MEIKFKYKASNTIMKPNDWFSLENKNSYRDVPASETVSIIKEIESGEQWREVVARHFENSHRWLFDVITYKNRDLYFRLFCQPQGAVVLDIGSGWGQIALPLARNNQVCIIEPTPERSEFIRAVARQEGLAQNMFFVNADYMHISFETRFDLITCIGVLEWIGAFSDEPDAQAVQRNFLKKIRSELRDGGQCVIGIENRLGLKYLLGAPDDHLGVSDIALFDAQLAKQKWFEIKKEPLRIFTYTMAEYREMLQTAGFQEIRFFAAFPDYKLPQQIIAADEAEPLSDFFLRGGFVRDHDGSNGQLLSEDFQECLGSHYRSLADLGIVNLFSPSYFITAC